MVNLLLKFRANLTLKDELYRTPLHYACSVGNIYIVNALLAHMKNFLAQSNYWINDYLCNPLILKTKYEKSYIRFIRFVNASDCFGKTSLDYAAENGHLAIVKRLLQCKVIRPCLKTRIRD